jgi:hypothetical protein
MIINYTETGGYKTFFHDTNFIQSTPVESAKDILLLAQDADVVGEPVQQRAGQTLRPQHRGPVLERQVLCHDGRTAFVALREGLEQQHGAAG